MLPPLSLYIHFPWCMKKCPYCDFNSHEASSFDESAYIQALKKDLEIELPYVHNRKISSIFLGGGTPSLFSPDAIGDIIQYAKTLIGFEEAVEITLEANPGTTEASRFKGYHEAGINRLSLGVQSFQDSALRSLGRIHNADEARRAICQSREAGFNNLNIDLMHGLPNQTPEEALDDLSVAFSFAPEHLSWYQLTLEPNTRFAKFPPQLPEEDSLAQIEALGLAQLFDNHYERYEVSAYCRMGFASKHNLNYWQFGDYLGIGAGAHSKLTHNGKVIRRAKKKMPRSYLNTPSSFAQSEQIIEGRTLLFEYLLNRTRLMGPILYEEIEQGTQMAKNTYQTTLETLATKGLIEIGASGFKLTSLGHRFLNDVQAAFLEDV